MRSQIKILQPKNRSQKSQQTTNLIMLNGRAKSVAKFCDQFLGCKLYDQKIGRKNRSQSVSFLVVIGLDLSCIFEI